MSGRPPVSLPWEGEVVLTEQERAPFFDAIINPHDPSQKALDTAAARHVGRELTDRAPCQKCGWTTVILLPPKGPHSYGLRCSNPDCARHAGWLRAAEARRL